MEEGKYQSSRMGCRGNTRKDIGNNEENAKNWRPLK